MTKTLNAEEIPFEEIKTNTSQEQNAGPSKEKTETIDLGEKKTNSSEKTTIDFTSTSHVNEFVKKKTVKAAEVEEEVKSSFSGTTTEQVKEQINKEENNEQWKPEDFEMVADIIITVLDTFSANLLRIWAKDTSDTAYSLTVKKKAMLVRQLSMILIKYQAKFKIEFLFLLSIIMFYAGPFMAAKAHRKEVNDKKQEGQNIQENNKDVVEATVMTTQFIPNEETGKVEELKVEEPVILQSTVPPTRRKTRRGPGNQHKH